MNLSIRIETLLGPLFMAIFAIALSVPCLCASAQASVVSVQTSPGACSCSHGEGSDDSEDKECCCGCDMAEEAPQAPVVADTSGAVTTGELRPQLLAAPLLVELPAPGMPEGILLAQSAAHDPSPPWRSPPPGVEHATDAAPTYLRVQTLRL
ncbi:hypothetical protein FRC98_09275 [Lujinxingia vulgaris]|uniref:Uncharacterized protein n=1 Tax=Lujinxingia vulgaris TaxID=2600176 RepID=A0A5C6X923_9DELT|nr:hypothetical protein [Lujinxingia vulgaris]TXD37858.1 hypothetical protein FRC98_09275 [Lujinxingia vulgaris]